MKTKLTFLALGLLLCISIARAQTVTPDEANAANVKTGAQGFIEGIQSEG